MKRNRLLEAIVDPTKNFLVFVVIGIFGLGIISDGLSTLLLDNLAVWLQARTGMHPITFRLIVISAVSGIILGCVYFTNFSQRLQRLWSRPLLVQTNVEPLTHTYGGLIAITSLVRNSMQTPAEIGLRHHWDQGKGKLRLCWLLCTEDALPSTRLWLKNLQQDAAKSIAVYIHDPSIPDSMKAAMPPLWQVGSALHIQIVHIAKEQQDDPNHIYKLVNGIYDDAQNQLRVEPSDLIADYTGGTKSMTAGMVLACSVPERQLQYLASRYGPDGQILKSELKVVKLAYRLRPV
jgi:hypothetical protein